MSFCEGIVQEDLGELILILEYTFQKNDLIVKDNMHSSPFTVLTREDSLYIYMYFNTCI